MDPENTFLVVLYFAELDKKVKPGQRVFSIWANGETFFNLDLAAQGGVAVVQLEVKLDEIRETLYDGTEGTIKILLYNSTNKGGPLPPIINGLEIYEVVEQYTQVQEQSGVYRTGLYWIVLDCTACTFHNPLLSSALIHSPFKPLILPCFPLSFPPLQNSAHLSPSCPPQSSLLPLLFPPVFPLFLPTFSPPILPPTTHHPPPNPPQIPPRVRDPNRLWGGGQLHRPPGQQVDQ